MFNRKKVKKLTEELNRYKTEIDRLNNYIYQINSDEDSVPENCKRGSYCSSCAFAEKRYIQISKLNFPFADDRTLIHYVCKKGNVCQNYEPINLEEK